MKLHGPTEAGQRKVKCHSFLNLFQLSYIMVFTFYHVLVVNDLSMVHFKLEIFVIHIKVACFCST